MKKGNVLRKVGVVIFIFALVISVSMAACAKPTPAPAPAPAPKPKPIVLKYMGYTTAARIEGMGGFLLRDKVAELSNGELTLDYKGGPEVIPSREQFPALKEGIVDVIFTPGAFHETVVPGVFLINLAKHNPDGTRPQAVNDFINELYKPHGVRYLSQPVMYMAFHVGTNVKVETLDDLRKLRIGAAGTGHLSYLKRLGANAVSIENADRYTAVDRGVVDAQAVPLDAYKQGMHEVLKYLIFPPYKWNSNMALLINQDTYNRLPTHLQDVMKEAAVSTSLTQLKRDMRLAKENLQHWLDAGVGVITFTGADAEEYLATYNASHWERMERLGPEKLQKAKELANLAKGSPLLPE